MSTRTPEAPQDVQQRIQHDLDLSRQSVAAYKERLKAEVNENIKRVEIGMRESSSHESEEIDRAEIRAAKWFLTLIDQTV